MSASTPAIQADTADRARSAGVLLLFLLGSTAVIVAGSALAQPYFSTWYATAAKAPWDISPWLRASLWMLAHIAMSVAAWMVWLERRRARVSSALSLYGTQLLLHALWRPALFVFYPVMGELALWLGGTIMLLMAITVAVAFVEFRRVSRVAGILVIPYLSWVLYVLSLNIALIALN
jgi:tryptophan-rich sensory protein